MDPGSPGTRSQFTPATRLHPLDPPQRPAVPEPPLPLTVQTRPLGRATLVLYQRGSFISGVLVQVFTLQSNMLERTVVLRPPFTRTRPSGNVTKAPQNIS